THHNADGRKRFGEFVGAHLTSFGQTATKSGEGDSASIEVTAEVGQTIVVEAVDADDKPTKWKAADYQPRTHWSEWEDVLPETTAEVDTELSYAIFPYVALEVGKEYLVNYNGVEYVVSNATNPTDGMFMMGNVGAMDESFPNTGEPFILGIDDGTVSGDPCIVAIPLDGSATVTLSVSEEKYHTIPKEYVPKPYYVYDITKDQFEYDNDGGFYRAILTEIPVALLEAMYLRMPIYMRVIDTSLTLPKEYMASATWGGAGIDYLWSIVDKASETIPVDGSMTIMDIRLSAHLSDAIKSFTEYFVSFTTTVDEETTE
ncbi:MAG: hypothetical protein IJW62_04240, partial [Clostridia bacterium]|nr:hypothetical protein [Clostridia bacterium]